MIQASISPFLCLSLVLVDDVLIGEPGCGRAIVPYGGRIGECLSMEVMGKAFPIAPSE